MPRISPSSTKSSTRSSPLTAPAAGPAPKERNVARPSDGFEGARQVKGGGEPAVMTKGARYAKVPGQLFVNGIRGADVMQGAAGDCYFLSSLAGIANRKPALIKNAIHKRPDGRYAVRFFQKDASGSFKPVTVVVDGKLPKLYGRRVYAHDREKNELWVSLMEKAYAKWKGSYGAIGHGGYGTQALEALTGKPATFRSLPGQSAPEIFSWMKSTLAAGNVLCAVTGGAVPAKKNKTGLVGHHFYTVLGTKQIGGKAYVELRNPWGRYEPSAKQNGKDDGVFWLPMSTFMKVFLEADTVKP